jgi:hypothetical protein
MTRGQADLAVAGLEGAARGDRAGAVFFLVAIPPVLRLAMWLSDAGSSFRGGAGAGREGQ